MPPCPSAESCGDELVVDLRGEVALEEADHDSAGQGQSNGQEQGDERHELRG